MLEKILVAYDGSKPAERAFQFGLHLAKPFGASITVLAVMSPPEPATRVETEAMLENANEHFEADFSRLKNQAREANIRVETKVAVGHAAEQIVHVAAEQRMDLIIMGHRGRNILARWLLGSVSKRVMSYAPCSVLIVR